MSTLIINHTAQYRQVRVNTDYTVTDVFSIRRTSRDGDPDYQTTYQDPTEGRYTLTCLKGSDKIRVTDMWDKVTLEQEEVATFIQQIPPLILEWLRDITAMRHSNFVPPGYGWDGKFTRAEYQKRQRANMIFVPGHAKGTNIEAEWLDTVLDEICRTPKSFLQLRWHDAVTIPLDRTLSFDDGFIKKDVIYIYDNGNLELQKFRRVIGQVKKHPGIKVPSDVERVIILTRGVTCDEYGSMIGCGVELLREHYNVVTTWAV